MVITPEETYMSLIINPRNRSASLALLMVPKFTDLQIPWRVHVLLHVRIPNFIKEQNPLTNSVSSRIRASTDFRLTHAWMLKVVLTVSLRQMPKPLPKHHS